eukprot:Tbor_TRINITY_DN4701_c0_g1::TRINITY_DN4701_c0_g1_i1::g.16960::m.16960
MFRDSIRLARKSSPIADLMTSSCPPTRQAHLKSEVIKQMMSSTECLSSVSYNPYNLLLKILSKKKVTREEMEVVPEYYRSILDAKLHPEKFRSHNEVVMYAQMIILNHKRELIRDGVIMATRPTDPPSKAVFRKYTTALITAQHRHQRGITTVDPRLLNSPLTPPPIFRHAWCKVPNYNSFTAMLTNNFKFFGPNPPPSESYGHLFSSSKLSNYDPGRDLFVACLFHTTKSRSLSIERFEKMVTAYELNRNKALFLPPMMTKTGAFAAKTKSDIEAFEEFCLQYLTLSTSIFFKNRNADVNTIKSEHLETNSEDPVIRHLHDLQEPIMAVHPDRFPILNLFLLFRGLTTGQTSKTRGIFQKRKGELHLAFTEAIEAAFRSTSQPVLESLTVVGSGASVAPNNTDNIDDIDFIKIIQNKLNLELHKPRSSGRRAQSAKLQKHIEAVKEFSLITAKRRQSTHDK